MQKQITIQDILYQYGEQYIRDNLVSPQQKGLIRLLSACGTSVMGNHFQRCDHCGHLEVAHNSCRNRHCPSCQQKDKIQWLDKRMDELLPTGYYHLVFTLPHELNPLCLVNKSLLYGILFQSVSQTLIELARDTRHLGADIGLITMLHTWGQNMLQHPHLHCIMPAGGLSFDREHWVHPCKKNHFFIHVKVLSKKFQGKFLDMLKQAYFDGKIEFKGKLRDIAGKKQFSRFIDSLYQKKWVVNIQKPFGKPEKVLEYLSRYVFRIAISDRRIIQVKDGKILFSWKDYRTGRFRQMKLDINEFIRRFLLHILPKGFFKIRYYGILSNRYKKENIRLAKQLLEREAHHKKQEDIEDGLTTLEKQDTVWEEILALIRRFRRPNCPQCQKGYMCYYKPINKNYQVLPNMNMAPG